MASAQPEGSSAAPRVGRRRVQPLDPQRVGRARRDPAAIVVGVAVVEHEDAALLRHRRREAGDRRRHLHLEGGVPGDRQFDHKIASGFTGEPVARGITSGATTNWNSHRPSSAHAAASGSKSALSRIGMPMYGITIACT